MSSLRWVFDKAINGVDDDRATALYRLVCAALAVFLIGVPTLILLAATVGAEKVGQTGDAVGGFLNPALTFLSFLGVIYAIVLQQRELSAALDQYTRSAAALESQYNVLQRQSKNSTFLMMLEVHRHNVDGMSTPRA